MRRYIAHKRDSNQNDISKFLTNVGCDVFDLSPVGGGVTDLLVGTCGVNLLIEIKSETGILTPKQSEFHGRWRGRVDVVRSVDEALQIVRAIRREVSKCTCGYSGNVNKN